MLQTQLVEIFNADVYVFNNLKQMPAFTHKGSFNLTLTFMDFMESYDWNVK